MRRKIFMAGGLLFVTQALLDSWAGQGRIELTGNILTLQQGAGKGRSYALEPAVRFLKVLGEEEDSLKLLAKVKQVSQLREMGAEQVSDSVIVGEVAYEVESGFLAEAAALQAASSAPPAEGVRAKPAAAPVAPPMRPALRGQAPAKPVAPPRPPAARPVPQAAVLASPILPPSAQQPAPLPRDLEEKRKEAEALARFLLENLS